MLKPLHDRALIPSAKTKNAPVHFVNRGAIRMKARRRARKQMCAAQYSSDPVTVVFLTIFAENPEPSRVSSQYP